MGSDIVLFLLEAIAKVPSRLVWPVTGVAHGRDFYNTVYCGPMLLCTSVACPGVWFTHVSLSDTSW